MLPHRDWAMPTLYKPQLIESESPWLAPSDRMYRLLCLNKGPILMALGFYAERDLAPPDPNEQHELTNEEEAELRPIASALTAAAAASEVMPNGILVASLKKISMVPSLFFTGALPGPVEWALACRYQRDDETPGTHWRDVWGNQPSTFEGEVQVPTELNLERAAKSAMRSMPRKRGPPANPANQVLAHRLGEVFRLSGQRIVRHQDVVMAGGKAVLIGVGPFFDFLNLVLPPLQGHLRERRLAPVTIETIVRLATM
jgi:hypothetical protein